MSRTRKDSPKLVQRGGRERHISVRGVRRDPPDLKKLSRALIQLAMAQAEAEAEAERSARNGYREHRARQVAAAAEDAE